MIKIQYLDRLDGCTLFNWKIHRSIAFICSPNHFRVSCRFPSEKFLRSNSKTHSLSLSLPEITSIIPSRFAVVLLVSFYLTLTIKRLPTTVCRPKCHSDWPRCIWLSFSVTCAALSCCLCIGSIRFSPNETFPLTASLSHLKSAFALVLQQAFSFVLFQGSLASPTSSLPIDTISVLPIVAL